MNVTISHPLPQVVLTRVSCLLPTASWLSGVRATFRGYEVHEDFPPPK